ncbi:hypothetical protein U3516DRAFT_736705 [Neocallimastix sp. 'constans']
MNYDNSNLNNIKSMENYILKKLCYDNILINESKITFTEKESYYIVLKILPSFNILFNKRQYTLDIYNIPLVMNKYNKWKLLMKLSNFKMYNGYDRSDLHINIPIKINYNKLFGNFYTRYVNNKNKILPVITDKEYCDRNCTQYIHKGIFSPTLFMPYGFELSMLYIVYFDIDYSLIEFKISFSVNDNSNIYPYAFSNYLLNYNSSFYYSFEKKFSSNFSLPILSYREKVVAKKPTRLFDSETQDSRMFREDITFYDSYYESPLNNIIPICYVIGFSFNMDSLNFVLLVIMLNATKLYTLSIYIYEFIISSSSNLFCKDDPLVKAIFYIYTKNNISIIDSNNLQNCIKQFVQEDNKVILISEECIKKTNYYLWYSFHSNVIPEVSIIYPNQLESLLPELSDLYDYV